jgi:hypothetical protein
MSPSTPPVARVEVVSRDPEGEEGSVLKHPDAEKDLQTGPLAPQDAAITPASERESATIVSPTSSATQRVQYRVRTRRGSRRS